MHERVGRLGSWIKGAGVVLEQKLGLCSGCGFCWGSGELVLEGVGLGL